MGEEVRLKSPSLIFITHGHGDHFFGAGPTRAAFPEAQLVTLSPQVVDEARGQTEPQGMGIWNAWFEGQFDEHPAVPTALTSGELEIEGHAVHVSVAGQGDGVLAAIVHVPGIATVCSGDVLYPWVAVSAVSVWRAASPSKSSPAGTAGVTSDANRAASLTAVTAARQRSRCLDMIGICGRRGERKRLWVGAD